MLPFEPSSHGEVRFRTNIAFQAYAYVSTCENHARWYSICVMMRSDADLRCFCFQPAAFFNNQFSVLGLCGLKGKKTNKKIQ